MWFGDNGMQLIYREFNTLNTFDDAAVALLEDALSAPAPSPRAIMLTGGTTPFGVYAKVAARGIRAASGVNVLLSDERYVPMTSPLSNYGRVRPFLDAVGVKHCIFPDATQPLEVATEGYGRALASLLDGGISFPLGILGLGADGHVAALFNGDQIEQSRGRWAMAVNRPDGMAGISATPSVLCAARRLVFWVTGPGKRDAVEALRTDPRRIPAGLALDAACCVELWYVPV